MRVLALAAALVASALSCALPARADVPVQRVSGKTIAAVAAQELARSVHDSATQYAAASFVPDQIVSDGRVHLRAQSPIGSAQFVNVPVQIEVNGRLDRTVLVAYRLEAMVVTAVATHDLLPGTVLAAEDVAMQRVPFNGRPTTAAQTLIGRKLIGAAVRGERVTLGDTQVNQIVKAGTTVVFTVRDGDVAITADTVARTGGGLGEQVVVYNAVTHKQLTGVVTGPDAVELDITQGEQP